MARAPALFFRLELPDTIVYTTTTAFVDINFTVVEQAISSESLIIIFSFLLSLGF